MKRANLGVSSLLRALPCTTQIWMSNQEKWPHQPTHDFRDFWFQVWMPIKFVGLELLTIYHWYYPPSPLSNPSNIGWSDLKCAFMPIFEANWDVKSTKNRKLYGLFNARLTRGNNHFIRIPALLGLLRHPSFRYLVTYKVGMSKLCVS